MSQENIEVLRKGYEAWNRGEHPAFNFMEPEFELQLPEGGINVGTVRGRESVQNFFAEYLEVFETYRMEPVEFFEAEDQVVVFIHAPARGKGSGVDVVFSPAHLWTMNGGRAVRLEVFPDRKEALEAVGLSEQAMSQEKVELQHRLTDAFNRRDLDAFLALTDEDVEAIPRFGAMEGGYHGHDGTRRMWTDLLGAYPDFSIEFYEVHDMGGNVTLGAARARSHGAGSDTPIEQVVWQVIRWRRGRCFWWAHFDTRAEALEASGLSE